MPVEIEARAYRSDSTEEEVEALRGRVTWDPRGWVAYREIPVFTPFSLGVLFGQVGRLEEEHSLDGYTMYVDVSEAGTPNAATRQKLRELLADRQKISRLVVFSGKNALINVAVKFVASKFLKGKKLVICSSHEEALEVLQRG